MNRLWFVASSVVHLAICVAGGLQFQKLVAEIILLRRQSLICMLALAQQAPNKKRPAGDCCAAYTSPTLEK